MAECRSAAMSKTVERVLQDWSVFVVLGHVSIAVPILTLTRHSTLRVRFLSPHTVSVLP